MATSFLNQNFDDEEESDNDFNPEIEKGSDAESDARSDADRKASSRPNGRINSDDAEDRKVNGDASPIARARSSGRGEDEEEDNGEEEEGEGEDLGDEDEEDEDDEDVQSRPRKRRRRGGLNQFFEEEAEVDEDDDELEQDDDELREEFIQETHPDDDLPPEADTDDRRHRELDRKRQLEASMDAEKQAAEFRERYGRRTTTALSGTSFVPQNLLMPDVNDPSIWGIRCREGKEKDIVFRLMRKFMESQNGRNPLNICSVFERGEGPMKGYVFVEARKKVDVDAALNGVADVYPRSKMNLVPVKEMPDLLRVTKSKELKPGNYVRIKRGLYGGDLAIIEDAVTNGLDVTVKLVPRLTYGMDEDTSSRAPAPGPDAKRKRVPFAPQQQFVNRPPPRLFNEQEAKKRHARFLQATGGLTRKTFTYKGENYEDGYLLKTYKLHHLITDNVQPKLEETQMFAKTQQDGSEGLDLEALKHTLHDQANAESSYQVGDEVEVFAGEQRGIIGRTERVSGNIVALQVSEGDLAGQLVEVPVKSLRKRFSEGDNVIVVGASKYRDQVGTVLAIKDDKVTILSQDNQNEITVFSKDLREATGAGGSSERSKFDVRDLVQLTTTTFGCVVGADPQTVRIMNQNGSIETRLPSSVSKIEQPRNVVAVDKNGSEIRRGDSVKEAGGEGRSGVIIHIYRSYLFAHDRARMVENAGIWVARCISVIGRSARTGAQLTDLSKMNPALKMPGAVNGDMGPPQRPGLDKLMKKHVKITRGPYKGHRGIVKDTTAGEARVELESKNKVVNISKMQISIIDPNTNATTPYSDWVSMRGPPRTMATGTAPGSYNASSRIPDGGRTPAFDGGRTPAWGSSSARTPAWGGPSSVDSSRTPAWRGPSGSQTSYGGAGNMTSYGGSRTPAWSSSAKTPYGGDHGFGSGGQSAFDAFAQGSRTPAYLGSAGTARTPAWSGSSAAAAPTPAASGRYDAPTPAAAAPTPGASRFDDDAYTPAFSAPTPGATGSNAYDAPTPGFARGGNTVPLKSNRLASGYDAPTPAASAPTPYATGGGGGGSFDAPTPGPGQGGGPRYVDDDDDE